MNQAAFVHNLSDLLRSHYRPIDYAEVIFPLLVIRRLNGFDFETISQLPPTEAGQALVDHLDNQQFAADREIFRLLSFKQQIPRLVDQGDLLPLLLGEFARLEIGDAEARLIVEEVTRQFMAPERGEFFTPPEAVELMVDLLLDGREGSEPADLYDPTCGLGGMLFAADDHAPGRFNLHGQELDPVNSALAKVGLCLRGFDSAQIKSGNTLTNDGFANQEFDMVIANPPFGVSWKREEKALKADPRFSVGFPRVNDSTMLFMQHCMNKISKTGRVAIITNGSPLFTGKAGSGESNIRRWLIENDWVETIIGLPDQFFYNTGIQTYVWLLTRNKSPQRRGSIQLIDAGSLYEPLRRSEGEKRKKLKVADVLALYHTFETGPACKILPNSSFGYRRIKTTDPERGPDSEIVPLQESVEEFFARWVLPHAPGTVAVGEPVIGYEVNFNHHFYTYTPPRQLEEITADILALQVEIEALSALI